MRIMAIDYGDANTGIAVSDPTGFIAGFTTVAQLMVTFTIPQNNSTPVGEKTIYLRIVSPSGQLLGNGGTFPFEGGSVECSAKKIVEYAGEEIGGVTIYWDVNTALTAGDYTVELFADNYRLISRSFSLN